MSMVTDPPGWMIHFVWFIAGVFATGAVWYFLSKGAIGAAAVSGLGAVAFAGLAIFLHRRKDAVRPNKGHIDRLSRFLVEAQTLRAKLNDVPLPVGEHNAWVEQVSGYLRESLGEGYAVRFSDFSGMTFYGDNSERSGLSRSLEGRSRRLHEFLQELGR